MRKIAAILLLTLMLFNLVGYKLLFSYLDTKAVADMVQGLDNNKYSKSDLVEVKVPLHLPYTSNTNGFERFDGTIQLEGVSYNYVERKITNDTLVLHCLPNTAKDACRYAEKRYAGVVTDVQSPSQGHKNANSSLLIKTLLFAGFIQPRQYQVGNLAENTPLYDAPVDAKLSPVFARIAGEPPEAA